MSLSKLLKQEAKEYKYLDLYHSHPFDPGMFKASGLDQDYQILKQIGAAVKSVFEILRKDSLLVYARAMAKNTVQVRVSEVLKSQPSAHIIFINGSESTISRASKVKEIIQYFKDMGYRKRMRHIRFPGVGHLGIVHGKVYAAHARFLIVGSTF